MKKTYERPTASTTALMFESCLLSGSSIEVDKNKHSEIDALSDHNNGWSSQNWSNTEKE